MSSKYPFCPKRQKKVVLVFQGGNTSSDATLRLLKKAESMTRIVPKLADCIADSRRSSPVLHVIVSDVDDTENIVKGKRRLALFSGTHQESSYQSHHP